MVIIINDQQQMSGKTTLSKEIVKGKNFKELPNMASFTKRFINWEDAPEWIIIDGCSLIDIELANKLTEKQTFTYHRQYDQNTYREKVPHFILITNIKLQITQKL